MWLIVLGLIRHLVLHEPDYLMGSHHSVLVVALKE